MKIKILGAHNIASLKTGLTTVLVDGLIAVDAGSLVTSLTFEEQKALKAVFLTHRHYDHIKDIPGLCMSLMYMKASIDVYASEAVQKALFTYLVNDDIYIDFTKRPEESPALRLHTVEAGKKEAAAGYEILPVPVVHSAPCMGYQITGPDGKKVFITSDTGPGLEEAWRQVKPDVLVTEVTAPNSEEKFARDAGHLTPALLQKELESFKNIHNYLPQVVLQHVGPFVEKEIREEINSAEKALKHKITVADEGMTVKV